MVDGPWDAAFTAQEEQRAGLPPRPMLTRTEAMAKANAYFREEGMPDVAVSATPNPLQGLWIVGHHDPDHPLRRTMEELLKVVASPALKSIQKQQTEMVKALGSPQLEAIRKATAEIARVAKSPATEALGRQRP